MYQASPGVMTHYYTDPPLTPQTEEWRVPKGPHPDGCCTYCGSTPTGNTGGSVVALASIRKAMRLKWIETIFRAQGKGLD